MANHDIELTGLDFVADVLQPIQLVVWGDLAIRYLGVPVVHDVNIYSSNPARKLLTSVDSAICLG